MFKYTKDHSESPCDSRTIKEVEILINKRLKISLSTSSILRRFHIFHMCKYILVRDIPRFMFLAESLS